MAGRDLRIRVSGRTAGRSVAIFALAGLISMGSVALAAGSGSGYVTGVNVEFSSGKFSTSTGHPNAPACATTARWAVDVSTPQGQSLWSTVLLAYSQNKPVTIGGTGQCNVWGDSETVAWIQLP